MLIFAVVSSHFLHVLPLYNSVHIHSDFMLSLLWLLQTCLESQCSFEIGGQLGDPVSDLYSNWRSRQYQSHNSGWETFSEGCQMFDSEPEKANKHISVSFKVIKPKCYGYGAIMWTWEFFHRCHNPTLNERGLKNELKVTVQQQCFISNQTLLDMSSERLSVVSSHEFCVCPPSDIPL